MQHDHNSDRKEFRYAAAAGKDTHIFQAVYNQQAEYCRRKDFPKILDILRGRFPGREEQERKKPCQDGSQNNHTNSNELL